MIDTEFIVKSPQLETSQDYAFLRREGLKYIEKLGHELWTDYNVHDPGITLLELLCYAVTDLGYRTPIARAEMSLGYDIKDILTETANGIPVNRGNFHTARETLTSAPVTFSDFRKLLIDVEGVQNAWVEKHTSVVYCLDRAGERLIDCEPRLSGQTKNPALQGLYDVFLQYEDWVEGEARVLKGGLPDNSVGTGETVQPQGRGIRFNAAHDLTLAAVSVYPASPGVVTVRLVDSDGREIAVRTIEVRKPGRKNRIPLGFFVPAGENYVLDTKGTSNTVRLYRTTELPRGRPLFPRSIKKVIELVSGAQGSEDRDRYFFFYDWEVRLAISPEHAVAGSLKTSLGVKGVTRDDVRLAARERLHSHRNLCEDIVNICDVEVEEIGLCADIEVSASADLEETLAEIFYQLDQHVSPSVNFYTIQELEQRGKSMDEIFEGPALEHGFIDDDEFKKLKRRCEIRVSDVVKILMDVSGVTAIKQIALLSFVDGEFRKQDDWVLELTTDSLRAPVFRPARSKIIFYKNNLPYFPNREEVEKLIEEKKSADLKSKLKGHQRDLPVPTGQDRNVETYTPAQNELPATYRVGKYRVEESASALRKAQSRQLKAYLMFFEQLLANYLSQLAHVRQLFSWEKPEKGEGPTFFTQPVSGIADLEDVYLDYESLSDDLEEIIESPETAARRRSRFLDHLIARFCESFTDYSLLMYTMFKERERSGSDSLPNDESVNSGGATARVIADKRAFLQDYPALSRNRGQGYDIRYPNKKENLSGYQRRVYRLLGIHDVSRRNLAGHRFEIEKVAGNWQFVLKDENRANLFESIACSSKSVAEALLDSTLKIGSDPKNYRRNQAGTAYELVLQCPGEDEPRSLGHTRDLKVLSEVLSYFQSNADSEGFHVIEHIFLRKRTSTDRFLAVQLPDPGERNCVEVKDPYSFRMTVLLPSWPRRFQDLKFRHFVEDTLRVEAPAHIYVKICWISHAQMRDFEMDYNAWAEKLAALQNVGSPCRTARTPAEAMPLTGQLPLPETGPEHLAYRGSLDQLITRLDSLVNVHPVARLHDCIETYGDAPQVTLNNTSLGTF
ncbi:MAG: hypothetical protein EHM61_12700 [Acidobacteria bacterium]|nr:MAG: hypothetical protein EHM61_12700 [Acidobacteriota bacterium]